MSEEASGSKKVKGGRLRDIPSLDYNELNNRGTLTYKERFSSLRTGSNYQVEDSDSASSSPPFVSPLQSPSPGLNSSSTYQPGFGLINPAFDLTPSQLRVPGARCDAPQQIEVEEVPTTDSVDPPQDPIAEVDEFEEDPVAEVEEFEEFEEDPVEVLEEVEQEPVEEVEVSRIRSGSTLTPTMDRKEELLLQLDSLAEDIQDHFDENQLDTCLVIEDVDKSVSKLENLRSQYRFTANTLKRTIGAQPYVDEEYGAAHDKVAARIKAYIVDANAKRSAFRRNQIHEQNLVLDQRDQALRTKNLREIETTKFLREEVDRMLVELTAELALMDTDNITNEEIVRRKEKFPQNLLLLERCSNKVKDLLEVIPENYQNKDIVVADLTSRYNTVLRTKTIYETQLTSLIEEHEINKESSFKSSSLNIKLEKFKGYSSEIDIYTFQSDFEKLYLKTIPSDKLPDLLKNNHLANPALAQVKSLDNIDEIWKRLKQAYGDPKVMLQMKMAEVERAGPLTKHKDPEAKKSALVNMINSIADLVNLTTRHGIQQKLYYGESLSTFYRMIGDPLVTSWLKSIDSVQLTEEEKWTRLTTFLEKELRIQQEKALINFTPADNPERKTPPAGGGGGSKSGGSKPGGTKPLSHLSYVNDAGEPLCHYCGEAGHVATNGPNGTKLIQYFSCEKFAKSTCTERLRELRSKELCHQCLYPGAKQSVGKHAAGKCQSIYTCKHEQHARFDVKKHVLVCNEHSQTEENQTLLKEYVTKCILGQRAPLKEFSKDIKVVFHAYSSQPKIGPVVPQPKDDDIIQDHALYMMQTILVDRFPAGIPDPNAEVEKVAVTLFFDNGCSEFVSRFDGIQKIGKRSILERAGPTSLGGVGDTTAVSKHGEYQVRLPLHNGMNAVFSGICLDKITVTFPQFPLDGEITKDIHQACNTAGYPVKDLSSYPPSIGGDIDFMIGMKYIKYFPVQEFALPSGFAVCRSPFVNIDGSRGVLCGPHSVITSVCKSFNCTRTYQAYLSEQMRQYRMGHQVNPDCALLKPKVKELDFNQCVCCSTVICSADSVAYSSRKMNEFEAVESAGSEITYRCVDCRECTKCKCSEKIELVSIKEEVEQDVIRKSVTVNPIEGTSTASLPFIKDPVIHLAPNKDAAMAIYKRVIRDLNKKGRESRKEEVIKSEAKMQALGFVDYVKNLTPEQQRQLAESPIQNFIPWHAVYSQNSVTTPCRVVFNGSFATASSCSLNDILAKGYNTLNSLVEIFIRWLFDLYAYHCDVAKAYNSVKLQEEFWCFQRYIFQKDLDPACIPEEKVIKTIIYGVKSSGNQTECALRQTADLSKDEFPEVCETIHKYMYMDDCQSGEITEELRDERTDQLALVLKRGHFFLKGFTFSGKPPLESLSVDGESIMVAGHKWYSEEDTIALRKIEMDFTSKKGRKKDDSDSKIPERLTRRHCACKVAEVYDLIGRITPIVAEFKLDLRILTKTLKLDWDDVIPDNMRELWLKHFGTMEEIGNYRYQRCVVPIDAVNLDVETIDTGDASKEMACSAIYARILRKTGEYSCQLVFARSKLLPEDTTQPRAELVAAVMNAHTGEVVRRALGKLHKSCIKLTDSQIVLHWLNNTEIPLKLWPRNRVIEVLRFGDCSLWLFVDSHNMIADLGTRRGATFPDVEVFNFGFQWMRRHRSEFPAQTYQEVKDTLVQSAEAKKELLLVDVYQPNQAFLVTPQKCLEEVAKRYHFSNYIYDPNKYSFSRSVMVVSLVHRFINNCREKVRTVGLKPTPTLPQRLITSDVAITDEELKNAENYYYRVAALELKQFAKSSTYEKISVEKDGILLYKGRILPSQQIEGIVPLTDTMKDLTAMSFCVPIVDKFSPVALGVINDIHWNHTAAQHTGVETVLRYSMSQCYIIDGREIVRMIGKSCQRCRYLRMRTIEVCMGPISNHLTIAPAFYVTQVDLAGPFNSYSPHNKRSTVKIYLSVFCCVSTSTVSIRVMEDYTSDAFVQAFIRLSCEVGYPKILLTDLGSQLLNASNSMTFSFKDVQDRLFTDAKVEVETCPVGGHNMHGKVERKIRDVRASIAKMVHNERLSILQWETLAAEITNAINDMPLGYINYSSDLESLDVLTPNRLKLGRNNNRSPVGPLLVTGKSSRFMKENSRIFNSWFEHWLISYVPSLMRQQKWFDDDERLSAGDIVVFLKKEGELNVTYQYGMIKSVQLSKDGKVRTVDVEYRNSSENVSRVTHRAVRELVLIRHIDEIDILSEMGIIASAVDAKKSLEVR